VAQLEEPEDSARDRSAREASVLGALGVPHQGRIYDLEVMRHRGMPLWDGHPPFEVLTYRTPRGIRAQKDQEWLLPENNEWNLGVISDFVLGTTHSGTHIDALAHVTAGPDSHWHGGFSEAEHLGDWGPLTHDGSAIAPLVLRGVVIDVGGLTGADRLPKGYGVSGRDLERAAADQNVSFSPGNAVLVRTGQMRVWPDKEQLNETLGSGVDLDGAKWLIETAGASLVGNDTESFEQVPASNPRQPNPVHRYLLVENGTHMLENLYLEELVRDGVREFLLIVLPLKIRGTTASMVRPIAIV
jgi:kynurenine formamidase